MSSAMAYAERVLEDWDYFPFVQHQSCLCLTCSVHHLQAARGKTQGDRPMSADSRPATAPEHAVAPQSARSGSLNALFRSPAASPAPQAQGPSFMGSSLYSGEGLGFRFPGGVSQGASGSLSPFPGMTANRMAAPISRPPPLSQVSPRFSPPCICHDQSSSAAVHYNGRCQSSRYHSSMGPNNSI